MNESQYYEDLSGTVITTFHVDDDDMSDNSAEVGRPDAVYRFYHCSRKDWYWAFLFPSEKQSDGKPRCDAAQPSSQLCVWCSFCGESCMFEADRPNEYVIGWMKHFHNHRDRIRKLEEDNPIFKKRKTKKGAEGQLSILHFFPLHRKPTQMKG